MVSTEAQTGPARASLGLPSRWSVLTLLCAVFLLGPILAVFYAATGDSDGLWRHLSQTVLPGYVANTLILMAGVGALRGNRRQQAAGRLGIKQQQPPRGIC